MPTFFQARTGFIILATTATLSVLGILVWEWNSAHPSPPVCGSEQVACGQTCVTQDVNNCGTCGHKCASGEACSFGKCIGQGACSPGFLMCNDKDLSGGNVCCNNSGGESCAEKKDMTTGAVYGLCCSSTQVHVPLELGGGCRPK
jgi:hypothetical protein